MYDVVPAVEVLIDDGLHEPARPLSEVDGSDGAALFKQYGPNVGNVGVTWSVMMICIVTGSPHASSGVNVYDVVPTVDVLIDDGLHEPARPLSEVDGKAVGVAP